MELHLIQQKRTNLYKTERNFFRNYQKYAIRKEDKHNENEKN